MWRRKWTKGIELSISSRSSSSSVVPSSSKAAAASTSTSSSSSSSSRSRQQPQQAAATSNSSSSNSSFKDTISAAGLTLKRNSCRSGQSTLKEEVQSSHWWPVQWSVVGIWKTMFSWRWRNFGARARAWIVLCAAACVMVVFSLNFGGVRWG